MKKIFLDFAGCKYIAELHDVIEASLDIRINGYGRNLDALSDSLCCLYDCNVKISISGLLKFSSLGADEGKYIKQLMTVFEDAQAHEAWLTVEFVS